jgi:flagellar FliL protein
MSTAIAAPHASAEGNTAGPASKSGRLKLIVLAVPVLLIVLGAGLWFTGILPRVLGLDHSAHGGHEEAKPPAPPVFVDVPELVANLNGNPNRPSFVKLLARIEVAKAEDAERVRGAMPRLQDMFQTYLREMRPEEMRGSAGTYRLREELVARANIVLTPVRINDLLFIQLLVQ